MAITDAGKLFESTSTSDPKTHALGFNVKAGTLIVIALAGTRGSSLNISSISDSKGNTWDWKTRAGTIDFCGVAWCRTPVPMTTADTITINWNGTPTKAWVSAHAFEGASGTPIDEDTNSGTSTTCSVTLAVSGSDWLDFAACNLPYEFGVTMTPINSSISQDDNAAASSAPWCECFSRNGTTGSTHQIGGSISVSVPWAIAGVSFGFEAMPAGRSSMAMFGAV